MLPARPERTAAAFADPIAVGPWFAGQSSAGAGWQDAALLYDGDLALEALLGRVAARLGTTEPRVAASVLQQGWAGRLFSLGLGLVVRQGVVADLTDLQWRDDAGSVAVRLPAPAAWEGGPADMLGLILDSHLAPLAAALRPHGAPATGLLQGNAASALLSAARVVDGSPYGPANDVARDLVRDPRLTGAVSLSPSGWQRRSCCLFYRAGGGLCGDCSLDRLPHRR